MSDLKKLPDTPDQAIEQVSSMRSWPKWVRRDKVAKVYDLPIFPLVHDWLLHGKPDSEIARLIHDHGYYLDQELVTVAGWVSNYRATVPKGSILAVTYPTSTASVHKQLTPMRQYMENLDKLTEMQWHRVQRVRESEQSLNLPVPMKEVGYEIDRYVALVESVFKLRDRLGFTDKQIEDALGVAGTQIDLDKIYDRRGINDRLKDPISRAKILGTVERLFDIIKLKQSRGEEFIFDEVMDVNNSLSDGVSGVYGVSGDFPVEIQVTSVRTEVTEQVEVIEQLDISALSASDFDVQL